MRCSEISELFEKNAVPIKEGAKPLPEIKENEYLKKVKGWNLIRNGFHKLKKEFYFNDFNEAIRFVNEVAKIATVQNHHPDIFIYYDYVVLELYTHAIKGLHLNDFIVAAKVDALT